MEDRVQMTQTVAAGAEARPTQSRTEALEAQLRDAIDRTRSGERPLILWGAGSGGRRVHALLVARGGRAHAFVDSDPAKAGRVIDGLPIISPEALGASPWGNAFVVVASAQGAVIARQLSQGGLSATQEFTCLDMNVVTEVFGGGHPAGSLGTASRLRDRAPSVVHAEPPAYIDSAYANLNFDVLRSAPCWMTYGERLFLYTFAAGNRPRRYLEVGTARGGSAIIVSTALRDVGAADVEMTLVDTGFDIEPSNRRYLGSRVRYLEGDSSTMIARAAEERGPFDLVLIDGDHSYSGAKRDILLAMPAVTPGGYVLLHDAYNLEIAQAIREAVQETGCVDCGLVCTHGNDMMGAERFTGGPYAGELLVWGGLYLLRRPAEITADRGGVP
jgi:predicted O-methyltransferase YrrM